MKSKSRILMLAAAVTMILVLVFPLWKITLIAPQYPKGIHMYIWINKISGSEPSTLQNINILNHYIGMKPIKPESIPELQYMQYIIMGIASLAFLLALFNKWKLNLAWLIIVAVVGILSIYDFYLWEWDYGHNLNINAPIKIEGMAYQPPLIGKKIILNFTAISFPMTGALFMILSFISGSLAIYFGIKKKEDV
jgi:copper chaperone NosL